MRTILSQAFDELYITYTAYVHKSKDLYSQRKKLRGEELGELLSWAVDTKVDDNYVNEFLSDYGALVHEMLRPDYQFQVSIENAFHIVLQGMALIGVFTLPEEKRRVFGRSFIEIERAREKLLFAMGKLTMLLDMEGRRLSDQQSEHSKVPAKNKVGHDAVCKAFYVVEWEGLKFTPISEKIRKYLLKAEEGKPEHRRKEVYSEKHIRTILKEDPGIKKELITEGVLKE